MDVAGKVLIGAMGVLAVCLMGALYQGSLKDNKYNSGGNSATVTATVGDSLIELDESFPAESLYANSVVAPSWVESTIGDIEYVRGTRGHCYSITNSSNGPRVNPLSCKLLDRAGEVAISSD